VAPPAWVNPPIGPGRLEDDNGPLLKGDPLLDRPAWAPPGWFAALEIDPVGPHIKNQLTGAVASAAGTNQVSLPSADQGWTVAPRFEVGYRLDQGAGELLASYRFVESAGVDTLSPFAPGGAASLRSRLDVNVFDLDYASREFSLGPGWDLKWLAGVRVASLFLDSQAANSVLAQRTANHFVGAGPNAALELWRSLGYSGLGLFGRLDFAMLFGPVHQAFEETATVAGGQPVTGETLLQVTDAVQVLCVEVGLAWTPTGNRNLRFAGGYLFERWWGEGSLGDSKAEVTVQGLFLRGEWRY
jgi:hypothetical protein